MIERIAPCRGGCGETIQMVPWHGEMVPDLCGACTNRELGLEDDLPATVPSPSTAEAANEYLRKFLDDDSSAFGEKEAIAAP